MNDDRPKLLGDAEARSKRFSQLREPHILPLTAFVERLRAEAGADAAIPYFDPWDGGTDAEVLFLLEAPGPKAVLSGFISRNNPDETAKNMFELNAAAGLHRKKTILWNAVPWYIGSGTRIRAATPADLEAGLRPLPRLLGLLPKVHTIVLVGRKAQRMSKTIRQVQPHLTLVTCPHPSPMFVNRALGNREKILAVLRQVAGAVV
jgi:uracil-DNA glycosylase